MSLGHSLTVDTLGLHGVRVARPRHGKGQQEQVFDRAKYAMVPYVHGAFRQVLPTRYVSYNRGHLPQLARSKRRPETCQQFNVSW